MYIVTNAHEGIEGFFPHLAPKALQDLYQLNRSCGVQPPHACPLSTPPYTAFWLPHHTPHPDESATIPRFINSLPTPQRRVFAHICQDGIEPYELIKASLLAKLLPPDVVSGHTELPPQFQTSLRKHTTPQDAKHQLNTFHKILDSSLQEGFSVTMKKVHTSTRQLEHAMRTMNHHMALYQRASGPLKHIHKPEMRLAYHSLQQAYQQTIPITAPGSQLPTFHRLIKTGSSHKYGFSLSARSIDQVSAIATHSRYLGQGLMGVSLLTSAASVYGTYRQGGDWERELAGEVGGFVVAGIAGSIVAALLPTPTGWIVAIISVTAGSVAGGMVGKYGAEFVWDRFKQLAWDGFTQ